MLPSANSGENIQLMSAKVVNKNGQSNVFCAIFTIKL